MNKKAPNALILDVKRVDRFVQEQQQLGNDVRWDGWQLVFFRPEPKGVYNAEAGAYRNGSWGFENRVPVNNDGKWEIDFRNIKRRPKKLVNR